MDKHKNRTCRGHELAELAAATAVVIPIATLTVYLAAQAANYVYLKTGVDAAARTEARWLAINFNYLVQQNGNSTANYANWKNTRVRINNCIESSGQFINGTIDSAGNFIAEAPPVQSNGDCMSAPSGQGVVVVKVIYPGDSGLPNWPSPPINIMGVQVTPSSYTIAGIYCADIEP